jgi:hypothetical protein
MLPAEIRVKGRWISRNTATNIPNTEVESGDDYFDLHALHRLDETDSDNYGQIQGWERDIEGLAWKIMSLREYASH